MAYAQVELASDFIHPKQAAALLGIHPKSIYELIAHGRIVALDVSTDPNSRRRTYRISRTEVERFLKGNTTVRHPAVRQTRTRNAPALKAKQPANDSE